MKTEQLVFFKIKNDQIADAVYNDHEENNGIRNPDHQSLAMVEKRRNDKKRKDDDNGNVEYQNRGISVMHGLSLKKISANLH